MERYRKQKGNIINQLYSNKTLKKVFSICKKNKTKGKSTFYSTIQRQHLYKHFWQMFFRLHSHTHTHTHTHPHTHHAVLGPLASILHPSAPTAVCWAPHRSDPGWPSPVALGVDNPTQSEPVRAQGLFLHGIWGWDYVRFGAWSGSIPGRAYLSGSGAEWSWVILSVLPTLSHSTY